MGYKCEACEETFNYADEIVRLNGNTETEVSECYDDYDTQLCTACYYGVDIDEDEETYRSVVHPNEKMVNWI